MATPAECEFRASQPFGDILASVQHNGLSLVRSLYPPELIQRIADAASEIYAERDRLLADDRLRPDLVHNHVRHRAIALADVAVADRPVSDQLMPQLVRSIAAICLHRPIVQAHPLSFVRSARPSEADLQIPYHQDSRILGCDLVNLWIPLADCGRALPGLEVVTQRLHALAPTGPSAGNLYAEMGVEIETAWVHDMFGVDSLWHPEFQVGDVLVFFGTTVHRTYVTKQMQGERLSIDLRLV
jgi:hypothetical protein